MNAVKQGAQILVLDDSGLVDSNGFAMPMLLAISHVHQLLTKADLRMSTSLVAKSLVRHEKCVVCLFTRIWRECNCAIPSATYS